MLWPKTARWGQGNTKPAVYCLHNTCTPRIHTVHSPAIRLHDRQHDAEVQNIHLIQNSRSVGAAVLLGAVGRHRARLEISERLLRRPPRTGGARVRLRRARQSESGGEIAGRVSSVQTRQRGLQMRADRAVVYSLRSRPQLLVLLLQFSHQFLELQHLQLRVGDFTVTTDVCHHLGAQHLCFHLVTRTLRGGVVVVERARPVCGGSCFCWKEGSGLEP